MSKVSLNTRSLMTLNTAVSQQKVWQGEGAFSFCKGCTRRAGSAVLETRAIYGPKRAIALLKRLENLSKWPQISQKPSRKRFWGVFRARVRKLFRLPVVETTRRSMPKTHDIFAQIVRKVSNDPKNSLKPSRKRFRGVLRAIYGPKRTITLLKWLEMSLKIS